MVDNPAACTFTSAISAVCPRTAEPGVLDQAGLTPREIADQLGHSRVSTTLDTYMGRKIVNLTGGQGPRRSQPGRL